MGEKDWDKSWSRTAMCPQQGCTWLKALGSLCTPKSEVNLSKLIGGQMVSLWEHVSQAVSEPTGESLLVRRNLYFFLFKKAEGISSGIPHQHQAATVGCTPPGQSQSVSSSQHPFLSFRSRFSFSCSAFPFSTQDIPQNGPSVGEPISDLMGQL